MIRNRIEIGKHIIPQQMEETNGQQLLALEELFKKFYKPLKAYAFRFINHQVIAEDIVQDVFFELWNKRETIRFDEPAMVKSYLFRSVHNRSLNTINSESLYTKTTLNETNENQIVENYVRTHTQNQEQSLLLKELEEEIAAFIETLPPQCKNVFVLSRNKNMKNKEIAEQLGISVKAVEKQITKALTELRQHLLKKDLLFILFLFKEIFK